MVIDKTRIQGELIELGGWFRLHDRADYACVCDEALRIIAQGHTHSLRVAAATLQHGYALRRLIVNVERVFG